MTDFHTLIDSYQNCACGQANISSKFCPNCGKKRED